MNKAAWWLFIRWWTVLWSLFLTPLHAAVAPPLSLSSADGRLETATHVAYLPDEGNWSPTEVAHLPENRWIPAQGIPNLGFTTQAYWFRLEVASRDAVDGLLAITYPALDHVRVVETGIDGAILAMHRFGDMESGAGALLPNRYFLTPVMLDAGERRIYLIRVVTDGSLQVPLTYYDRQHFYDREQRTLLIEGVYFGILLIMAVYNFFIYLVLGERSYAWYSLFVSSILVFQVALEGFGYQFIWPSWPWINAFIVPFAMACCLFSGAMFSLSFLKPARIFPRIERMFQITAATGFAIMLVSLSMSYSLSVRLAVIFCGLLVMYAIWAGFYLWYQGQSHARYYALGWAFLMPTIAILSLKKQGFLPVTFFTEYAIQIGSVVEATLFSFALGDRISLERRAKIQEQALMLEKERLLREELKRSHALEMEAQQKVVAAEAESRAKTRFLATMSHEIRTPLNGILGMIELLQGSELQPHQRTYTDVIAQSGQSLLSVINDILDYSKIIAGKMQIENLDFDLEQLCMECASVFAFVAEKKHIELLASNEPGVPVFIHSDPTRIRQILLNLLGNAFKFTEKGQVRLQISRQTDTEGDFICFTVSDTGMGIDPEQQSNLFESFAQGDSSTTRRFGGTGLGLAISKKLSELLGGDIGFHSIQGEGSRFWFRVAYVPADPVLEDHLRGSQQILRGKSLLVVDDSPAFIEVIALYARQWGMDVREAYSGEQALAYLRDYEERGRLPDVVTLDMRMPGMDGLACSRHIEDNASWRAIPRILLTAMQPAPTGAELAAAGIRFYQQKPVSARGLSDMLLEVFELRQAEADQASGSLVLPAIGGFSGRRVLVADDNEVNLTVITALLKKLGILVVQTNDGEQATDFIVQNHADIDLILMDCEMPVMDGFAATRRIRQFEAQQGLRPLPVVALTAHVLPEYQQRCLECGMDDYLAKPIQMRVLSAVLERCWGKPSGTSGA